MVSKPSVSVVIPTYDRSEILPRAVDSVLSQTYEEIELIVVDDASPDATPDVMERYEDDRLTYIRLDTNSGGSHARNVGIDAATGEYIAFLDDDDEWHPEKIERQVAALEQLDDEWIGVYCDVEVKRRSIAKRVFDVLNRTEGDPAVGDDDIVAGLLMMTALVHGGSTLLLKRDAVDRIGGFDESFPHRQDIEFVINLTEIGKIAYVDEPLVTLHDTPSASSEEVRQAQEQLMAEFSETVERLEKKGYSISSVHNLYISRQYFRQGRFSEGTKHLTAGRPKNMRHIAGLVVDILNGFKRIVGNRSKKLRQ